MQSVQCLGLFGVLRPVGWLRLGRLQSNRIGALEAAASASLYSICAGFSSELHVSFETGKLARLADGAVVASLGGTRVLATVVCASTPTPDADGVPLQVDYRERMSAAGRFPQAGGRRDTANSEREWLAARAVDRALRPLLPAALTCETHVTATVLSADGAADPATLAINAASAALAVSDVPWEGPLGAVQVALLPGGEVVVSPSVAQLSNAELALTYAGTREATLMVECAAKHVAEAVVSDVVDVAAAALAPVLDAQAVLAAAHGRPKRLLQQAQAPSPAALQLFEAEALPLLEALFDGVSGAPAGPHAGKAAFAAALNAVHDRLAQRMRQAGLMADEGRADELSHAALLRLLDSAQKGVMRRRVLAGGLRPDGRSAGQIRPLACVAGLLPAVHGSALFDRGDTQVLATATVGSERDVAPLDTLFGRAARRLSLQYTFPPFCVGEVGRIERANRREVGHGALAEKALAPAMPPESAFPFIARVNADTLGSHGSSSMAAVCAGAVALRRAGVPLEELVAGVSIGLITEFPDAPLVHAGTPRAYGRHVLLTDIQGLEDHAGDMDFKIAGSAKGVTAMQLDTKLPGLPGGVMRAALLAAREARTQLLSVMESALDADASALTERERPVVGTTSINQELLGPLIGVDGERLCELEERSGARLIVHEEGDIDVYAPQRWRYDAAIALVKEVEGATIEDGKTYCVRVLRVEDYGAYVELPNGLQALLHISEAARERVHDAREVLAEGQQLDVVCLGRDAKGLLRLSRKALLPHTDQQGDTEPQRVTGRHKAAPSHHVGRVDSPSTPPLAWQAPPAPPTASPPPHVAQPQTHFGQESMDPSGQGSIEHVATPEEALLAVPGADEGVGFPTRLERPGGSRQRRPNTPRQPRRAPSTSPRPKR